jgi:hypothetical protein
MDAAEQLKQDVRDGRIDIDRLIDVIVTLQRQLEAAKQRIEELERKTGGPTPPAAAKVDAVAEHSVRRAAWPEISSWLAARIVFVGLVWSSSRSGAVWDR